MNELAVTETAEQKRARQEQAWKRVGGAWLKRGAAIARGLQLLEGQIEGKMWEAGDWLIGGREDFGAHYKLGIGIFKYSLDTLYTAASVAGRIPSCRRLQDKLSFWHHREVARLDEKEQDRFLAAALRHDWSVRQLRDAVHEAEADKATVAPPECTALFVPQRWAMEFIRWAQAQDISAMPTARKRALRRQLEPIMAIYEALGEGLPTPRKESISALATGRCP